jgi:ComF family protein
VRTASAPLAYRLYCWLWSALDLLYPPVCAGCGARGSAWCQDCQVQSRRLGHPVCERCGQSLDVPGVCQHCQGSPPHFSAVRSWAVFEGPVRLAIHRLKYKRDISLGEALARPLIHELQDLGWRLDIVVPVPLGVARLKERGYNQATLLARPLALGCRLGFRPRALSRVRETRSQVGLSYAQRLENVSGAFQAHARWVSGRRVLVVDDVATSSATLDACAAVLAGAGATCVYGLTLARAGWHGSDDLPPGSPTF